MWLLPSFPWVSRLTAFTYYRVRYGGEQVPCTGPVLIVANHPNSLLDPVLVAAAARRPVRFLAKAPLFSDPKVGWLVRGSGAIPVYRRADDPTQMDRNEEMFRAVHAALAGGAAVGIFPEGLSHSEPALAALRTGAARIPLGAHRLIGRPFPIVPMGLVFRQKDVFRSEAVVLVGAPVPWGDLAAQKEEDSAVHAITDRLAEALQQLTVNLERWQDLPLVDCAMRIWEAERGVPPDPGERVARLGATTRILAVVRHSEDPVGTTLARDVGAHRRRLRRLGLRPGDLVADVGFATSAGWAARRVPLVMPMVSAVAIAGLLLFWVPYHLTGIVVDRMRRPTDQRSTYKLLVGIALYTIWVVALVVIAAATFNLWVGLGLLLGAPAVGMAGLVIRERWRGAWGDVRRFLLLQSRRELVDSLRAAQRDLGVRLNALYLDFVAR